MDEPNIDNIEDNELQSEEVDEPNTDEVIGENCTRHQEYFRGIRRDYSRLNGGDLRRRIETEEVSVSIEDEVWQESYIPQISYMRMKKDTDSTIQG